MTQNAALEPGPITVAVPVLNEEDFIEACLESLLPQMDPARDRIMVLDGGSTDRTAAIVARMAQAHPFISLVPNPKRLQSAGVNLAAQLAQDSAVLIRADAHALYPPGFVRGCADCLRAQSATSVVVPMRTVGHAGFQAAVAAAQNSILGNGGSAHRGAGRSGFVEHGHHAAFDKAFFLSVGGYEESFTHNEDAELDHRAVLAGGRIWMCGDLAVTYFPRKTLGSLARQYIKHGGGRARTLLRHRMRPRLRQLAPVVILLACAGAVLLSLLWWPFLLVPLIYAVLCCCWGAVRAVQTGNAWLLGMGPAAMAMHLGWGFGFLRQMAKGDRP